MSNRLNPLEPLETVLQSNLVCSYSANTDLYLTSIAVAQIHWLAAQQETCDAFDLVLFSLSCRTSPSRDLLASRECKVLQ